MLEIFNRRRPGADEIVDAIGIISADINYDKWQPLLPFGLRDVAAIIDRAPVDALCNIYTDPANLEYDRAIALLQQAVAFFTWLKIIPTLDAQHDGAGRQRRLGENEKGLTALQEYKDEENIRNLAYEAVDALIEEMERTQAPFWVGSPKERQKRGLLVASKAEFDAYYVIGSHRLFVTLLPMLRESQQTQILPIVGRKYLAEMIDDPEGVAAQTLGDTARRVMVLTTMAKAVQRLPVEVLPDGIVQVQQSQPIKQRIAAEKSARDAVASALYADADKYSAQLADDVAMLNADGGNVDVYVHKPLANKRGLTF